jgi:hypothetical protein
MFFVKNTSLVLNHSYEIVKIHLCLILKVERVKKIKNSC